MLVSIISRKFESYDNHLKNLSETLNQLKRPRVSLLVVSVHVGSDLNLMVILMVGMMKQLGNLTKDGIIDP